MVDAAARRSLWHGVRCTLRLLKPFNQLGMNMKNAQFKTCGIKKAVSIAAAVVLASVGAAHAGGIDSIAMPSNGPIVKRICDYAGPGPVSSIDVSRWKCAECTFMPTYASCTVATFSYAKFDPSDP